MTSDSEWIGRRVLHYANLRGMTQQQLADAVAVSQSYISRIQRGKVPLTSRALLIRLADALDVPYGELLGVPLPASTREDLITLSAVSGIRAALDYPDDPIVPRSRRELAALTRAVVTARMECEYAVISAGLPALLAETRVAYDAGQTWAGPLLVRGLVVGSLTLRPIGWQDLAMRLAERARLVAREIGEPDAIAAAEFAHAQGLLASGSTRRSLHMASAAAEDTPLSAGPWRGMLHLHAALSAGTLGNADTATMHLLEASRLAHLKTYRVDPWLMEFTPANVETWAVAVQLEHDPGRAAEVAIRVPRAALVTKQRISRLDADGARAFYMAGQPERAVRLFLKALEVAPNDVRNRRPVREIVSQMKRDARGKGSSELIRLTEKMGLAA